MPRSIQDSVSNFIRHTDKMKINILNRLSFLPALPRVIYFSIVFIIGYLLLGLLVRVGFYSAFSAGSEGIEPALISKSFILGLRYDLKLGLIILIPFMILASFNKLSPFVNNIARRVWLVYFSLLIAFLVLVNIFDFAHYAYLATKLSASVLNFLEDPRESAGMVWQTYPVFSLLFFWIVTTTLINYAILKLMQKVGTKPGWAPQSRVRVKTTALVIITFLLVTLGVHGKFSQYPLRWSDAYYTQAPLVAALALNPVLNFYDTRKYVGTTYSLQTVKEAYPRMAKYLGAEPQQLEQLDYGRVTASKPNAIRGQPNIVVILLESFSGYKSSLTGNALDTTPVLRKIGEQGIYFDHFFTSHIGTARGVFATLTGLPDVDMRNTSSRNPAAVDQHSLINALTGYDKHYFISGSTTWANVRGVIKKNILGVNIHEEGSFTSPVVDVWGISDKSLFLEANEVFRAADKPFFSVIQTSGNHRPYTIPAADNDFVIRDVPLDVLKKNGFFSLDEFNAFRYMDYTVGKFFEAAKREKYFDNTIFVFLGDHGITAQGHDVGPHMPRAYKDLKLSALHTPFVLYAPKLLKPARYNKVGSQIDAIPTVLGLTNRKIRLQGLGRDLLDTRFDKQRYAFTIHGEPNSSEIGILDSDYYYIRRADAKSGSLHAINSDTPSKDLSSTDLPRVERMNKLLDDYYQTALYLLTHNKQKEHPIN
jgi:phosphoglycerol transferase MdoB-like AlkP superfamily enzyme